MTAFLASVTRPEEAEIALAGGADIVDCKDPSTGALGALSIDRIREIFAAVGRRRPVSAVSGDLPMQPGPVAEAVRAIAATGVDIVKVGLLPEEGRPEVVQALKQLAGSVRLVGVLFADLEPDPPAPIAVLAEAGFAGIMLDTAKKDGRRLLDHLSIAALAPFMRAARERSLLVGLAGALEEPDVPRLLALDPDFLGFRGALCAAENRRAGIELGRVQAIRRLIPRAAAAAGNVDYRLLAARGYHPEAAAGAPAAERIFVRDYVLPVRIGAYGYERDVPQKVRFDVTVDVTRPRGEPEGMAQVFSYDVITDGIAAIVAEGHIDLVETLAERIAALVLREPRARRVKVRVEKLERGPGGVGVELELDRPDPAAEANPVLAMLGEARKPRP